MVKHVIIWDIDNEKLAPADRNDYLAKLKSVLEGLKGKIDGLLEIKVITEKLNSSNGDFMLDSLFESQAALDAYQVHPEHVKAAGLVRAVVSSRKCMDYTV